MALLSVLLIGGNPSDQERPRIRDLGVSPGILDPGKWNAITDVAGVRVGHRTLVEGESIRTGVTAILPHGGNLFQKKVPAAVYVGNGFGKAAGFLQVRELGNIETPIVLTNTLAVGIAVDAVTGWTLARPGNEAVRSVNAVVGETNDGGLNDIRARRVTAKDVVAAIEAAKEGPVCEGSVGAGTGTAFARGNSRTARGPSAPATSTTCTPFAASCWPSRLITDPSSGGVRPSSSLASVVLPLPDSPTKPRVSPSPISSSTPASAATRPARDVKVLDTFRIVTTGSAALAGPGSWTSAGVLRGMVAVSSWR